MTDAKVTKSTANWFQKKQAILSSLFTEPAPRIWVYWLRCPCVCLFVCLYVTTHFQPFPYLSNHFQPFLLSRAISSNFQLFTAIYSHLQPFIATSSHSCHIQPFPAISTHHSIIATSHHPIVTSFNNSIYCPPNSKA